MLNNNKVKISLIQIEGKSTPKLNSILINKNLSQSLKFNPDIIFTPECLNIITGDTAHLLKNVTTQKNCPVLEECINFAKKYSKYISVGSLLLRKNNSKKLLNRSFFINNKGKIISHYDKIHLFDARVNAKEIYQESMSFNKGKSIISVDTPWGMVGITICYDLRFPNLFRSLVKVGCKLIIVPAAFTIPTGKDHWEILLRARAIENTTYIVATGQCGNHHGSRKTYGHSLVVDPWGKLLIQGKSRPAIFHTTLDLNKIEEVRDKLPSIYHD